ncbi:hypothetical protein RHGRI_007716 [Rhododendron griersonianum]|uniref:Uncharacterized protein n=1 Tax=Rhododendron griersonianum TaxID=479676 RepID=A0AAV6KZ76_9ERIC|nr:hypothetical protein RHGRI_007716 [Rhododendron griersonianum]
MVVSSYLRVQLRIQWFAELWRMLEPACVLGRPLNRQMRQSSYVRIGTCHLIFCYQFLLS